MKRVWIPNRGWKASSPTPGLETLQIWMRRRPLQKEGWPAWFGPPRLHFRHWHQILPTPSSCLYSSSSQTKQCLSWNQKGKNERRKRASTTRSLSVDVHSVMHKPEDKTPERPCCNDDKLASIQGEEALKITRVGMYLNMLMVLSKGGAGVIAGSTALIADAAHSMSDLLSDFVTLWTVKIARMPPDSDHPYGYGKYEAVGSLTVGLLLLATGCSIGVEGFQEFHHVLSFESTQAMPHILAKDIFLLGLSRSEQLVLAAGAAAVSVAAKEALYHATVRIGKKTNSKVIMANAWHHRTDAISSLFALVGIGGTALGFPMVDPMAGILVAAMIVNAGGKICLDSVRELTDKSVEDEILENLNRTTSQVEDVISVNNVRARRMGPYTLVDLRIHVDRMTSISAAQQIGQRVKAEIICKVPDVSDVLVHVDAARDSQELIDQQMLASKNMRPYKEIYRDVVAASRAIPEILAVTHVNAHWVPVKTGYGTLVEVTIVVKPTMTVREAHEVSKMARKRIERIEHVACADIHLELSGIDDTNGCCDLTDEEVFDPMK